MDRFLAIIFSVLILISISFLFAFIFGPIIKPKRKRHETNSIKSIKNLHKEID